MPRLHPVFIRKIFCINIYLSDKNHAPQGKLHHCLIILQNNIISFADKDLAAQARQKQ